MVHEKQLFLFPLKILDVHNVPNKNKMKWIKVQLEKNRMEILLLPGNKTWFTKYKHTHVSKDMAERFEGILGLSCSLGNLLRGTFKCMFFALHTVKSNLKERSCVLKEGLWGLQFSFFTFYPITNSWMILSRFLYCFMTHF